MSIKYYLNFAELAQASYYGLRPGLVDPDVLYNGGDGMAALQAQTFSTNWTVIDQYDGMAEKSYFDEFGQEQTFFNPTGLSVTLFEDVNGNQAVAIRGTELSDINDLATDYVDIGLLGTSRYQEQYKALSLQVKKWMDDGVLQTGFSVTGHSLGGFLATNLALEYSEDVEHAYLYNAPGLTGVNSGAEIYEAIASVLSPDNPIILPTSVNISNIVATGDLVSEVGLPISFPIEVTTEKTSPWGAHGIAKLTDALAVYNLFAQADQTLTVKSIAGILEASAYQSGRTLELSVSALGEILLPNFNERTGDNYGSNRDLLYQDLHDITIALEGTSGLSIEPLLKPNADGTLTPLSPADIETQARSEIAYRYALVNGNPFVVQGVDYSNFNQNGELDLFDPATAKGQLTNMYLADRADFMANLIYANINDTSDSGSDVHYVDRGKDVSLNEPLITEFFRGHNTYFRGFRPGFFGLKVHPVADSSLSIRTSSPPACPRGLAAFLPHHPALH